MLFCCYGNKWRKENYHNLLTNDKAFFDTLFVAATDNDL